MAGPPVLNGQLKRTAKLHRAIFDPSALESLKVPESLLRKIPSLALDSGFLPRVIQMAPMWATMATSVTRMAGKMSLRRPRVFRMP